MFAVVEIDKKQYVVQTGDVLDVQKIKDASGKIVLDKVLLVANQGKVSIGTPYVDGAKVKADVEGEKKGKKIIVYKYKRRKKYRRKQGHRQKYTTIKITDIISDITKGAAKEKQAKTAKKETTKKLTPKKTTAKKTVAKKPKAKKTTTKKSTTKKSSPKKSS
ncbi:MAG: 50S ribosomal protein L21 [Candidatus Omnitrophica bacterium]|nr:50S ribosomal protein L21 [Candidatus Omnitrophota bacterium]